MEVIHQCRPQCKGEVETSPGRCRLARLLPSVVQRHRRIRLGELFDAHKEMSGAVVGLRGTESKSPLEN